MGAASLSILITMIELVMNVSSKRMTTEEKNKFLEEHNKYRRMALNGEIPGQPRAKEMPMLVWSEELAAKADKWSQECREGHDTPEQRKVPSFSYVGQNYAGTPQLYDALPMWFNEYKDYNFYENSCIDVCGHYTQIVWADTYYVGCAYTDCNDRLDFLYEKSIVCNYGEGGNIWGMQPYVAVAARTTSKIMNSYFYTILFLIYAYKLL